MNFNILFLLTNTHKCLFELVIELEVGSGSCFGPLYPKELKELILQRLLKEKLALQHFNKERVNHGSNYDSLTADRTPTSVFRNAMKGILLGWMSVDDYR